MFHSDSGIQCTSKEFFRLLKSKKIVQSVSRPGTPLDNAVAESFFATFKKEELYPTKNIVSNYILRYLARIFNPLFKCLSSFLFFSKKLKSPKDMFSNKE